MSETLALLSGDARHLIRTTFHLGKRSRLSGLDQPKLVEASGAALAELVAAKLISARRKPRMPDVMLYRGSPATMALAQEMARAAVPAPGAPPIVTSPHAALEFRMVPDPSMSDAEYFHQRQEKPGPYVGKTTVQMNMMEVLGGFARFQNRTDAQEAAAKRFKALVEAAQIGAARAIDYRVTKVDVSWSSGIAGEVGLDALWAYKAARGYIGQERATLLERVIVHDVSMRRMFPGARARERAAATVRAALDDLADHFAGKHKKAA